MILQWQAWAIWGLSSYVFVYLVVTDMVRRIAGIVSVHAKANPSGHRRIGVLWSRRFVRGPTVCDVDIAYDSAMSSRGSPVGSFSFYRLHESYRGGSQ